MCGQPIGRYYILLWAGHTDIRTLLRHSCFAMGTMRKPHVATIRFPGIAADVGACGAAPPVISPPRTSLPCPLPHGDQPATNQQRRPSPTRSARYIDLIFDEMPLDGGLCT